MNTYINRRNLIVFTMITIVLVSLATCFNSKVGAAPDAYPYPQPEPTGSVMINELSWAGTTASSSDEWIELVVSNPEVGSVNLDGWTLVLTKTGVVTPTVITLPAVTISNTANEYGHWLFERTDDNAVASVEAAGVYAGSLPNTDVEELALVYPGGEISDRIVMVDGEWPAGSASPRASMQRVQNPNNPSEVVWMTSNQGVELDMDGNTILGTPGSANEVPTANPGTCSNLPDKVGYDLDLIVFEDMSTTGQVVLEAELWGVDEFGSLVSLDGDATLDWVYGSHQWEVTSLTWDEGTSDACIDSMEMFVDATENILNGRASNAGTLPSWWQQFATFLNGIVQFQKSGMFTVNLPLVVTE